MPNNDTQRTINRFLWRAAHGAEICEAEVRDAERIARVLEAERGVRLSANEAALFWEWRSREYDASWLTIGSDAEILEWFDRLIRRERGDSVY
jgi:hypothetical protein